MHGHLNVKNNECSDTPFNGINLESKHTKSSFFVSVLS